MILSVAGVDVKLLTAATDSDVTLSRRDVDATLASIHDRRGKAQDLPRILPSVEVSLGVEPWLSSSSIDIASLAS